MHYHVAKGYIAEMLGNKYSCKGKKNEEAAEKINMQWTELNMLFRDMVRQKLYVQMKEHLSAYTHHYVLKCQIVMCELCMFLFQESTLDWLYSLGGHISKIIEQEHEKDIKNVLTPLVENYPDIR